MEQRTPVEGMTPLMMACDEGNLDAIRMLLQVWRKTGGVEGVTPLMMIHDEGNVDRIGGMDGLCGGGGGCVARPLE